MSYEIHRGCSFISGKCLSQLLYQNFFKQVYIFLYQLKFNWNGFGGFLRWSDIDSFNLFMEIFNAHNDLLFEYYCSGAVLIKFQTISMTIII